MTDWLIDTAAAVTVLIALVLLLRGPVMRQFGAELAYALWALPLARALLPGITFTVEAPAEPLAALTATGNAGALAATPVTDPTLLLIGLWLAGAAVVAAQAALAYLSLRRAIRRDVSLIDIVDGVVIVESGAVDSPVAIGLIERLVVLPRDFRATFTPAQQRHVIAHELEHHRGRDLACNLAAFALLALNWFNPIVWAGWRAFRQDQEAACDARTLARFQGDRAGYGRAIAIAVAGPGLRPAPALALAIGEKSTLIFRLRSLAMTDITPRRRQIGRAALACAALTLLPLTASVSYAVVQPDPPAPPSPPAPPASPEIDMTAAPGEYVRRIERGGHSIILRTDRALSEADVALMVADAESARVDAERATGGADASPGRTVTRITIRDRAEIHRAVPVPPVPPVPPAPPADAQRNGERQMVLVPRPATTMRCSTRDTATASTGGTDGRVALVRCDDVSPELRLSAVRSARAALVATPNDRMPADARRSAIAELDELIVLLERQIAS